MSSAPTLPMAPENRAGIQAAIVAAILVGAFLLAVAADRLQQGLDLEDQGLWMLGTSVLARGEAVHSVLETGDGPLRYWLLLPLHLLSGGSVAAWAWLHAVFIAGLGSLGTFLLLRQGAGAAVLLWPLGLLAALPLPIVGCAAVAALPLAHRCLGRPSASWPWILWGVSIGLVASLDLRWALLPALPLLLSAARSRGARTPGRAWLSCLGGALATVALLHAGSALAGAGTASLRNAWTLPLRSLIEHFEQGGAGRWWVTLDRGFWLHRPFAGLLTGETPPAPLPAHETLRACSVRLMAACAVLLPLVVSVRARARDRILTITIGLGAGWLLIARGDVPAIRDAFAASLLVTIPAIVGMAAGPLRAATALLLALAALPLAVETLVLVGPGSRAGTETWSRPNAQVELAPARIARLEELAARLGPAADRPVLIWPAWPGLHHVLELPLTTRWVTLRGTDPDPDTVLADLRRTEPDAVVLSADRAFPTTRMRELVPGAWQHLRLHYRVAATAVGGIDEFRLLQRLANPEQQLPLLPLRERVPEIELTVANDTSPALRRDLSIGQGFTLGPTDLEGFAVRWSTRGRDVPLVLRVRIWEKTAGDYRVLLAASTVETVVAGDGARNWFRYPVENTAGKELAIMLEALEAPVEEVRLYWHRHDAGAHDVDLFPDGAALLDRDPVDADLFFVVY